MFDADLIRLSLVLDPETRTLALAESPVLAAFHALRSDQRAALLTVPTVLAEAIRGHHRLASGDPYRRRAGERASRIAANDVAAGLVHRRTAAAAIGAAVVVGRSTGAEYAAMLAAEVADDTARADRIADRYTASNGPTVPPRHRLAVRDMIAAADRAASILRERERPNRRRSSSVRLEAAGPWARRCIAEGNVLGASRALAWALLPNKCATRIRLAMLRDAQARDRALRRAAAQLDGDFLPTGSGEPRLIPTGRGRGHRPR